MNDLKNCPFCGDQGVAYQNSDNEKVWFGVECIGCDFSLSNHNTPHQAIEHWNTRTQDADNLRLSNIITKFDTALRTIATEAGMAGAYSGVDTEASLKNFVNAISKLSDCSKCELEKRNIEDLW